MDTQCIHYLVIYIFSARINTTHFLFVAAPTGATLEHRRGQSGGSDPGGANSNIGPPSTNGDAGTTSTIDASLGAPSNSGEDTFRERAGEKYFPLR